MISNYIKSTFSPSPSVGFFPTWFLNDCIAGTGYLLSFGLIGVLVITEETVCIQAHAQSQLTTLTTFSSPTNVPPPQTYQPLTISLSPLHNSQTLLPPGEPAASPQTEACGCRTK